ncbi:MAG: hypothetical protein PHD12_10810 [Methylotenera sp.]|nr:hypothetical protein [Methylotenera sp.]
MNKHSIFYIWLLIASFFMVGCATPRNPDGTIDACKLTKPPKEAYTEYTPHMGQSFVYPNPTKLSDTYTGCLKWWVEDRLFFTYYLSNGFKYRIDFYDPSNYMKKITCEYDKNKNLTVGPPSECLPYEELRFKK